MDFLLSAIAFLVLLTFLVLIHELGHFAAARRAKVFVEEFGFGLPPRAKTLFWQGGTRFSLNWIPFGGFVRLRGENAATEKERKAPGSFSNAPIISRIIILVAGVAMNFLFALLIFVFGFSAGHWVPTYLSLEEMQEAASRGEITLQLGVLIEEVLPEGTAAQAGVPTRSILLTVDSIPITAPEQVMEIQKGKRRVTYEILTGDKFEEQRSIEVPLENGKSGVAIHLYPRELSATPRAFPTAVKLSLREAKVMTTQTVLGMIRLFQSLALGGTVPEGITGIVGIAQLTHVTVQEGFMMYLRLVALLSLSLAVLNILPLPALDGGRLVFVFFEALVRRPANRRFELVTNAVGFIFLILLILLITYHDIINLF